MTRREFSAAAASPAVAGASQAEPQATPPKRMLLQRDWPASRIEQVLLPVSRWRHFPSLSDRARWEAVPAQRRAAMAAAGEQRLGQGWAVLPASMFLEYQRNGNRSRYEAIRRERRDRLMTLALAELAENKGRFLDEIVDGVWATCEETYWGLPAHVGVQKAGTGLPDAAEPTVDLFAADTAATLSWIHFLMAPALEKVSPLVPARILREVSSKVLAPCFDRNDFWWMGLEAARPMNNWNPWICSNWLTAVLLVESSPGRRAATVYKILRCLDRFLDSYHEDGGCDEGPGYWGHAGGSLFECLELLASASAGKMDFFGLPLVGEIGRYIYRAHIDGDWYVNFADASARTSVEAELVYRYGKRIGDSKLSSHGLFAAGLRGGGRHSTPSLARGIDSVFAGKELEAGGSAPLVGDVWLGQTHFFAARETEGSPAGLYVAAQGGHNAESHNHNDVGNFIVFASGKPVLIDAGVETYTAKTFSSRRYEIWTMQSAYHNLPTVNGVMQAAGRRFEAQGCQASSSAAESEFTLDIARAYPEGAGIGSWIRTIRLDRRARLVRIIDRAKLRAKSNRIEFSLMTPCTATIKGPGVVVLTPGSGPGGSAELRFTPSLKPVIEEIAVEDARLKPVWGAKLRRLRLEDAAAGQSGEWELEVRQI